MKSKISFDNILVRHWIKFDYDTKDFYIKEPVHYLFKIKDSIHYKCLVENDFSDYVLLIKTTDQYEHSLKKFLQLRDKFDVSLLSSNKDKIILEWVDSYDKYVVIDGCHRLSVMLYNHITDLNSEWFTLKK